MQFVGEPGFALTICLDESLQGATRSAVEMTNGAVGVMRVSLPAWVLVRDRHSLRGSWL